jgi:hypothetical protein
MRYVKLFFCYNSDLPEYSSDKQNFDKYYPMVLNKDEADKSGYFWAVTEAKNVEASAVVKGSNFLTPVLSIEFIDENTINVYLRSPTMGEGAAGNTSEVVLHEALHAVSLAFTLGAQKGRSLTPKAEKFVNDLNSLYSNFVSHFNKRVKSGAKLSEFEESILKRRTNALVDPDEFLTWGMTNANAQEYLRGIEAGPGQTLFQRFVAMFKSMLGIPDGDTSALSRLIEIINPLFEATEADYKAVMGTPATGTTPAIGSSKARNQISEILKFGSAADMKDAIADLEKPDDKVMNERANLQKQNRGCD